MNPPFSKGQDIDHIKHAISFLEHDGTLCSVCSVSYLYNSAKRYANFADLMEFAQADIESVAQGAFKSSGTQVATSLIRLDMPTLLERFVQTGRDPSEFGLDIEAQLQTHIERYRLTTTQRQS